MIEAIMYAALGGLTVGLAALMIMPAIWRRAVRLTTQRVRTELPINLDEVRAERDQVRAERALDVRRVETFAETAQARLASALADIGRLQAEAEDSRSLRRALDARVGGLEADLARVGADLATRTGERDALAAALQEARAAVEAKGTEIAGYAEMALDQDRRLAEAKIDLATFASQVETLRGRLAAALQERNQEASHAIALQSEIKARDLALERERAKIDALEARIARLVADLADRDEILERRARDLSRLESDLLDRSERISGDDGNAEPETDAPRTAFADRDDDASEAAPARGRDNVDKALAAAEASRADLEQRLAAALSERNQIAARLAELSIERTALEQRIAAENDLLRRTLVEVARNVVTIAAPAGAGGVPAPTAAPGAPAPTATPAAGTQRQAAGRQLAPTAAEPS